MKKLKDAEFEDAAKLFSALSNPLRLKILYILVTNCNSCKKDERGCCVTDIIKEIPLPQPYISKHLKVLKEAGILSYERDGNRIYYTFQNNNVIALLKPYIARGCC